MEQPLVLVIATRNAGKTNEIRALLEDFPLEIRNLDDFGPIPEVVEDGDTFEENAYKKASFTALVLGFPALADDSGLVVPALDGAPGVHSARWAGAAASDADRCRKLMQAMAAIDRRTGRPCADLREPLRGRDYACAFGRQRVRLRPDLFLPAAGQDVCRTEP